MVNFSIARFQSKIAASTTDGATQYFIDLRRWLNNSSLDCEYHDFVEIVERNPLAKLSSDSTIVLASIGPYAFLYHYLREVAKIDVPIVRDVHSGLWGGYLMQEWLCEPLTRTGDVVIFPSDFARSLFSYLFPRSASIAKLVVAHPRFDESQFPRWDPVTQIGGELRVGYIGRLSKDKNLPSVLNTVAECRKMADGRSLSLHLIGGVHDISISQIRKIWRENGGQQRDLVYWGSRLPEETVRDFFSKLHVLLFLSTSNVEALGRVVIEARRWQVPVCMADHAAAPELAPKSARVAAEYHDKWIECANPVAMGDVEPEAAAATLLKVAESRLQPRMKEERFHVTPFLNSLAASFGIVDPPSHCRRLFGGSCVELNAPPPLHKVDALELIREAKKFVLAWAAPNFRDKTLDERLLRVSSNTRRSQLFLQNLDNGILNYADLGGFPFELAQILGFHPRFRLLRTTQMSLESNEIKKPSLIQNFAILPGMMANRGSSAEL